MTPWGQSENEAVLHLCPHRHPHRRHVAVVRAVTADQTALRRLFLLRASRFLLTRLALRDPSGARSAPAHPAMVERDDDGRLIGRMMAARCIEFGPK